MMPILARLRIRMAVLMHVAVAVAAHSAAAHSAAAHEGHDHGAPAAQTPQVGTPRVSTHSESYEVVGMLRDGGLVLYLDRYASNEPVPDASIVVTLGEEDIPATVRPDGTYLVKSERLSGSGRLDVIVAVSHPSGDDLLIDTLNLPATPAASFGNVSANAQMIEGGSSFVSQPMAIAVLALTTGLVLGLMLGLILAIAVRSRIRIRIAPVAALILIALVASTAFALAHEGHDHGAPPAALPAGDAPRRLEDGTVFLPKPSQRLLEIRTIVTKPEQAQRAVSLVGRVIGDPGRIGLVQSTTGGRVLAPDGGLPRIGQTVRKGDLLALVEPPLAQADRTTLSERIGEIEQQIAVAETRLRRVRQLVDRKVAPPSQVTDTEIELDGLRARREIVRQTRIEPEPLRAPVDGVVAMARVVPGQVIAPQDVTFQVVDPTSFWIEALAFGDTDPAGITVATAVANDGASMKLVVQGFSKALQQQATVIQFSVARPPSSLAVGQPVRVVAQSGDAVEGIILPRDAVVRSANGDAVVWRHTDPERFEARPVRIEPFDATRVVVRAGLQPGERVVVRGAGLINQVR